METSDQNPTQSDMLEAEPADKNPEESAETKSNDALYNDPLIDNAADPMTEAAVSGDFAPGAPDVEFDD